MNCKILIFEVENGMLGQSCAWGFESLGHTTKRVTFEVDKKSHYQLQYDLKNLTREILIFAPDFVLTLNFRGFDVDGRLLYIFHRLSIPVLVWFVDNPFALTDWDKYRFTDRFVKLIFDCYYADRLKENGIPHVYHLPLGTDTRYFQRLDLSPEERAKYSAEVCFVGKLDSEKARLLRQGLRERWPAMPPGVMEIIEEAIRIQADNPKINAREALNKALNSYKSSENLPFYLENPPLPPFEKGGNSLSCPSLKGGPLSPPLQKGGYPLNPPPWKDGVPLNPPLEKGDTGGFLGESTFRTGHGIPFPDDETERLAGIIVEFEASIHYRASLIGRLKAYDVAVYGEDDWREALDFIHLRGVVPYGPELAKIYNASAINLNISRIQLKSSVNQRVFDVPVCQAFLITDYREELGDYFEIGKEVICYRQPDELSGLIQYYLDHSEERERIAQAGYERVIREHTYIHRMGRVIEIFNRFVRDGLQQAFSRWEDKVADEMLGQIFNELSRDLLKGCNIEEAGLVLERAVELYPYDESFICNLALVKNRQGGVEAAEKLYLQALSRNPDLVPALVNLGHLYLRQGELEKAEHVFRRAIDGSEANPPLPPFIKGGNSLSCPSLKGGPLSPSLQKGGYPLNPPLGKDGVPSIPPLKKGDTGGFLYEKGDLVDIHAALGFVCARQNKIEACLAEAVWLSGWLGFSGEIVLNDLQDLGGLFDAISAEFRRKKRMAEADLTRKTAKKLKSLAYHPDKVTKQAI
ncbi:MAG: glycosyltransferase [Thermodesulfobacteriota bacterium]